MSVAVGKCLERNEWVVLAPIETIVWIDSCASVVEILIILWVLLP